MTKQPRYTEKIKRQAAELMDNRDKPAVEFTREFGERQIQLYK